MKFAISALTAAVAALPLTSAAGGAFSYDPTNEFSPDNWGNVAVEGNQCDGKYNSPIAVETTACDRYMNYEFMGGDCSPDSMIFELTPVGPKASFPEGCTKPTMKIPAVEGEYRALQFHLHTGSEHTIDGHFFGAELHIVHEYIGGSCFAVAGMMLDPSNDKPNLLFGTLLDGWQALHDETVASCSGDTRHLAAKEEAEANKASLRKLQAAAFNPYDMLPSGTTFYHYTGGLTTPPCSEVVTWNLADTPVKISPAQYNQLVRLTTDYIDPATCEAGTFAGPAGVTSRPVTPLNGRTVTRICPAGYEGTA